jgi:hypothetical protein
MSAFGWEQVARSKRSTALSHSRSPLDLAEFLRRGQRTVRLCSLSATVESSARSNEKVAREWHEKQSRREAGFEKRRRKLTLARQSHRSEG